MLFFEKDQEERKPCYKPRPERKKNWETRLYVVVVYRFHRRVPQICHSTRVAVTQAGIA